MVSFCGTCLVTAGTRDDRALIDTGNFQGKNDNTLIDLQYFPCICNSSNNQKWLPTLIAHMDKLDHKL